MGKHIVWRTAMVLSLLLSVCNPLLADTNKTLRVTINVELLDNGDALVSEERLADIGFQGTEGFISVFNLRPGMRVTDLQVSDENGVNYEVEADWDGDRSRHAKAYKCGYHHTSDGDELCWGIGDAGLRTYYIRYRVVGLVMGYTESDGFNHCFFSTDEDGVDSVSITFRHRNKTFVPNNPNVWMFGCYGFIAPENGVVHAYNTQLLASDEKMIIMMEFPKGEFSPTNNINGTFKSQVKDIAMEGSDYVEVSMENNPSLIDHIKHDMGLWWLALMGFFSLIGTMLGGKKIVDDRKQKTQLLENIFGKKKEVLWHRDVPLNGDLLRSRGIYNAVEERLLPANDTIAAITLRLLLQKKIEIRRRTNNDNSYVDLLLVNQPASIEKGKRYTFSEIAALLIHQLYYDAAGDDHLLEPKEIKKYFKENPVKYRQSVSGIDNALDSSSQVPLKSVKKDDALAVLGFEKFLKEFTLLSERGTTEAVLWKEYMVFATMFGISKRVAKELRAMLPEMPTDDYELYNAISEAPIYYSMASSLNSSMQHVRTYKTPEEIRAEREAARRSGGGGSSSHGGGGGFSGGGGSGFR